MDSLRPCVLFSVLLSFFVVISPTNSQTSSGASILGFTGSHAVKENETEQKFKAIPSPEEERRQHRIFTAEPHLAGSKRNNDLAAYIADEWRKQGMEDVVIRRYDVYSTAPKSSFMEMVAPVHYRATLREEPYDADPDT